MAGALSGRYRFADGGQPPQPFNYGDYAMARDPGAVNDPYVASSAASSAPPPDNPAAGALAQFGQSILGSTPPEQQYAALQQQRNAEAQGKIASIQRAMSILQAAKTGQTTNLPMLAAAGAMLEPSRTGTFGEALGKAFSAAVPATEQARRDQWAQAAGLGQLGVQAADVPLSITQEDMRDFQERMRMAEQAHSTAAIVGGRESVAQTAAGAKESAAQTAANARIQAATIQGNARLQWADINASRNQWQYEGLDPNNPDPATNGIYMNTRYGTVNFGPGIDPKRNAGSDPARIREASILVQKGVAPDFNTAYQMVKTGVNDANAFGRMVQAEKNTLLKEPRYQGATDAEIEAIARKNVVDRAQSRPAPGGPAPASPPSSGAAPAPVAPTQAGPGVPDQGPYKAVNPTTGETRIWDGTNWVPAPASAR